MNYCHIHPILHPWSRPILSSRNPSLGIFIGSRHILFISPRKICKVLSHQLSCLVCLLLHQNSTIPTELQQNKSKSHKFWSYNNSELWIEAGTLMALEHNSPKYSPLNNPSKAHDPTSLFKTCCDQPDNASPILVTKI